MKKWIILLFITALLFGCASTPKPVKSQLQIREFQTRTFETPETKFVMKAMLNVLQDDGFIVKNAVPELGLITAEKIVDVEKKGEAFMASFFAGANARWKKAQTIEASCNVTDYGDTCKVRVNFQRKLLNNKNEIVKIEQIEDQRFYQTFFNKVSKGIFIERQKL